MIIFHLDNF